MADLKERLAPLADVEMPERWSDIQRRAPRAGFDPEPPRRHPAAAVVVTVAITIITVGWLASGFRSDDDHVADEPTWVTTEMRPIGISVDHPPAWVVTRFDDPSANAGEVGMAVANRPVELVHPATGAGRSTGAWDMRELPDDAVVVWVGLPTSWQRPRDPSTAPIPPSLADLRPVSPRLDGDATGLRGSVERLGRPVRVEVWFGAATTTADRETVERILSSMSPSVPEGFPSVSPSPEPEPEPTLDPEAVDLGLGFGICDADSIGGAFGTGTSTRVWYGTRTAEGSQKCQRSSRQHVLAVDVGGDRQAEAWIDPIGPNVCWLDCGLAGLADLDADRTDEVVLLLEGGAVQTYGVVDIAADGQPTLLGYAGEPPQGIPANGPARFTVGGDEAYSYAVSCTVGYAGPAIEQRASAGVVDAPQLGATVQTFTVRLTPGGFEVLSDEVTEGVVPPPILPARSDLCGLELPRS